MRAKGTLAALFVLVGTAALSPLSADAADRNPRLTQKQTRPAPAAAAQPAPRAAAAADSTP
jgi:hypothetical protein